MRHRLLGLLIAPLLGACSIGSSWYLMDSGYAVHPVPEDKHAYAVEVHLNQFKQLGGEVNSPEFRLYVTEQLKYHGLCPKGWQPLPCVADGSCVQRSNRSVTATGRCLGI